METNWKKLGQRLCALLLCVAMLLPVLPQPVWAANLSSFSPVDPAVVKLPDYATGSGKVSALFEYDCGNGVENNGSTSGMKIVTGTNSTEFNTYCDALKAQFGDPVYTKDYNDNGHGTNLFRKYKAKDGTYSVYTYFLPAYNEARIIIDTHVDTVDVYKYEAGPATTSPRMVMYGLPVSPNGYHLETTTGLSTDMENNGALIIIRMKDNSLFINDGGILGQMSEAMAADLLDFCRKLTGTEGTNEKMVINTWFLSHAHDDHFQGFTRFININHAHFDLKNIMYNIDIEREDGTRDIHDAMQLIRQHYPDVRYYKPHTGEVIDVAGIKFHTMMTHEDRLVPGTDGVIRVNEGDTGTFRSGTYVVKDGAVTNDSDFNDTSTVLKVTFENNVTSILYGDMNKAEGILREIIPQALLKTDIMLVPHHGFDPHPELVSISDSKIYLYTQNKQAIYGTDDDVTTHDLYGTSRDESGGRMKGNFTTMFPGMNVPKSATPDVDYKLYWGGNETAVIDIEALASATTPTQIAACVDNSRKAMSFKYTGWTIESLTDDETPGVTATGSSTQTSPVGTGNQNFAYKPVSDATLSTSGRNGALVQDGRYLLMNKNQTYVMSYQAATTATSSYPAHAAGSLIRDDSGNSENSFAIARDGSVYLDHANRDLVTWVLRQFKELTGNTGIANGNSLQNIRWTNFADPNVEENKNPIYQGIELQKGLYGPNNGTTHGFYWDTNVSDKAYRFFNYDSYKQPFYNSTATQDETVRGRYCVEAFSDGTYVFYSKYGENDFRVIVCDEYGNWGVRRYCALDGTASTNGAYPIDQMRDDLEELKVRLYRYTAGDVTKSVRLKGNTTYNVDIGSDVKNIVKSIQYNVTVYDNSTQHPVNGNGTTAKRNHYHVDVSAVRTNVVGTYTVPVYYSSEQGATVKIADIRVNVTKAVTGNSGVVSHNAYDTMKVHPNATTADAVTFNYAGEAIDITVGMLRDANGERVDTSEAGTYTGLKVVYNGLEITNNFTLQVADDTLDADVLGIVKVGKGSTTSDAEFSATGVANIQLTASAGLYQKPVDLIFIVDLSGSMRYAPDGSTYLTASPWNPDGSPNVGRQPGSSNYHDSAEWVKTRLYALEESLVEMVETLQRNDADVRIAISDFGDLDHYEFYEAVVDKSVRKWPYLDANDNTGGTNDIPFEPANQLNFILGRDDEASAIPGKDAFYRSQPFLLDQIKYDTSEYYYHGRTDPMVFTGSGKVDADAFQDVNTIDLLGNGTLVKPGTGSLVEKLNKQNGKKLGTNYDVGLETAYRLAKARQDANEAEGLDRDVVCIFMSDGAAMQYNYFSGRALTEAWSQYLIGETDEILENFKGATATVTDENGNTTEVNVGAHSWTWGEYENYHPQLRNLMTQLHQRLANGNLDNGASYNGGHFDRCGCAVASAQGKEFFNCLINSVRDNPNDPWYYKTITYYENQVKKTRQEIDELYWEALFQIVYKNTDGDKDDLSLSGESGEQFRKNLVTALRQPNYHTVQADTDVNGDGIVNEKDTTSVQYQYQTYSPYYYFYNTEGKNWWAEAIKGDRDKVYPVINRFAFKGSTNKTYVDHYQTDCIAPSTWGTNFYNGEVPNNFSGPTTQGLALDKKDYVSGFKGLGLDIYTIGFSMASEFRISADEANAVLGQVCSGPSYQKNASSQAELTQVLSQIITSTASPATGAYFTDTMGDEFDLSTEQTVIHRDGEVISVNSQPTIRVMEYKLDGRGDRIGEPTVIETITFEGGKVAKSDLVYTTTTDANGVETKTYPDIWDDTTGLITGKRVIYNTNKKTDADQGVRDLTLDASGRTYSLAAETFFWIVGRLDEDQVVLEYQAHLTGSTEGTRTGLMQSYATNASAVLNYNDYLGHLTQRGTVSPVFEWATDMIVVDYGLPVSVSVPNKYTKDNKVLGVHAGGDLPGTAVSHSSLTQMEYGSRVEGKYGTMEVVDGEMTYTPTTMDFPGADSFAYAIEGDGENYYSVVHVIPATTIYYEDSFVDLEVATKNTNAAEGDPEYTVTQGGWTPVGASSGSGQNEDRPGAVTEALKGLDADSIYGFDSNYKTMASYSYGSAVMANVKEGRYATAKFDFTGTGFDVISLTSDDTGVIVVKVTDEKGTPVANYLVDTYYGYKFVDGKWIVDTDADNAIYQVPVIKVDLNKVAKVKDDPETPADETVYCGHGKYHVEIVATYAPLFDHGQCDCTTACNGCYDFYLDAVRIYDPANDGADDTMIRDAYIADNEYLPTYEELRNMLIGVQEFNSLGNKETAGVVFIDGNAGLSDEEGNGGSNPIEGLKPGVTEYANYGPNNELYLAAGQAVAFALSDNAQLNKVHMAMKSFGGTTQVTVYGVDANGKITYVMDDHTLSSTTDLYYDISTLKGKTVVIRNTGDSGLVSITNLKSTYGQAVTIDTVATVSAPTVKLALASLEGEQAPIVPVEGTIVPQHATLSFEDEILMNIYFKLDGLDVDPAELGLITFTSELTDGTMEDAADVIPGAVVGDNGIYMVRTNGIAAKDLVDTVYFRIYAKLADGSYVYSKTLGYSARAYADSILSKSGDVRMKSLVVAMLNYAASAQNFFGYRTDALINSGLSEEHKALVRAYSADLVSYVGPVDKTKAGTFVANGGFGKKFATVSLEGAFAINYYLEKLYAADGAMKLYYWMQEDFEAVDVLTAENATGVLTDSISVSGIAAKDLNRAVYVAAVYEHDGQTYCSGVLPYSIGTYCAGIADEYEYAKAMVVYGSHAEDYFG